MHNFYELHQYDLDVVHHRRVLKYESHLHNEFEIIYLFDGEQGLMVNDTEYTLQKGDCAVIYPTVLHSYTRPENIPKNNSAADSAIIFMPAGALYGMFPETRDYRPADCVIRKDRLHENVVLAFDKIFEETDINAQIGWAYIIFSHTIPTLSRNGMTVGESSDAVSRLLSYINTNFKNSLTLDMVAEELHMNKYRISRIFSNKINLNFRGYISMLRANHAASLIKISDDNFENIAADSGFESLRTFYRVFRDIYGVSPSEYRDMIRKYRII